MSQSQKVLEKGKVVEIHRGIMAGKKGEILGVCSENVVLAIEGMPGKVTVPREDLSDGLLELPNLEEIKVKPMTKEEQVAADEEYRRRKQFAEGAGEKLAPIEREIAKIKSDPEKLELTPSLQHRLKTLEAAREKLLVEDEGIQKHTRFAALLEEVRQAKPEEFGKYFYQAIEDRRYRETIDPKGKSHVIFHEGKIYELVPDATDKITAGSKALDAELRKLQSANREYRQGKGNAYQEAVIALKAKATEGLTLSRVATEDPTPVGTAYGYLPRREETNPRNQQKYPVPESHFLVECDGQVIRPIEAVGRLQEFFAELGENERYITVRDLKEGRLGLGGRLPEEVFKELRGFLGILLAAIRLEPAPQPKTEKKQPARSKTEAKSK